MPNLLGCRLGAGLLVALMSLVPPAPAQEVDVASLVERAKKSVVVVSFTGRDGRRLGMGTGFVISPNGLIATNLHVIGEGRPIAVEFPDTGKKYPVKTVHASERALDLALIKIDANGLPALELGDSDKLRQGQPVVALGNPLGLKQSVVRGVVSGRRTLDGKPLIQLAIPIEKGNSGGPLLDADGNVHGILTLKSLVTENLGFAVAINALKPLIKKPNPVPMSRWLTIGAIDPREWQGYLGARWRQRAGRILVEGGGTGFGRRSYCVWQGDVPPIPYEVTVTVRLDDEAGAAGLLVAAEEVGRGREPIDVEQALNAETKRHYGFYPTAGQLRLARFEGPDVRTWQVLQTVPSEDYRPGDWNTLKVRVEEDRLLCYVNDQLVINVFDRTFRGVDVGVVKFRDTKAEFKAFRVANKLPSSQVAADVRERINRLAADVPAKGLVDDWLPKMLPEGNDSIRVLRDRAKLLEQQAEQLRRLARDVHHQQVLAQLVKATKVADDKIDLFHVGLLIAHLDNDELDVAAYRKQIDRLAAELSEQMPRRAGEADKLAALNKFFFSDYGFHGSRTNYYHRSNSYLNEVLDDREGLPIALSVLYMEIGRRAGLNIAGVGLPRHFVVKHVADDGKEQLIDVYDGGTPLSRRDAEKVSGTRLQDEHFEAATRRSILVRMLGNLMNLATEDRDEAGMLRYLDAIVAVAPDEGNYRGMRAVLRMKTKRYKAAIADCDWLLKQRPEGVDLQRVRELREYIERLE